MWTRSAPPKPERLNLDAILKTAVELADTEGLETVTVRRLAAQLNARPMSLYSFFARKDDLVELMTDHVLGEMLLEELPPGWRDGLRAIARRTREVGLRHPWLMAALSRHPGIGPNALRHMEQSLAAVAELGLDDERARRLLHAVDFFTVGYGALALAELDMRRRDQVDESAWRASAERYFDELTGSEDLPHLARLGSRGALSRDGGEEAFATGFEWLLAGFAAELAAGSGDGEAGERQAGAGETGA